MPRPRKPRLVKEINRHGTVVWYYRDNHGPRIRLRGAYGSPEFIAAYDAAARGERLDPPSSAEKSAKGSLAWLIGQYMRSGPWAAFKPATRRQRENIFRHVVAKAGNKPYAAISRKTMVMSRDAAKSTPAQANNMLKVMRGLFAWAISVDLMEANPVEGVPFLKVEGEGFHPWTDEELDRFEATYPLGTRERVAYAVLLYTGQRRGDVVRMGRQHVRDGVLTLRQEKTGMEVHLPILKPLAEALGAGPTGDLAFIAGVNGRPMVKESFGTWFRGACNRAGAPNCSAHGLRKAGARRAAENGATAAELNAIFGWTGARMASLYTASADRKRLAGGAMGKLEKNEMETSYSRTSGQREGSKAKTVDISVSYISLGAQERTRTFTACTAGT
jgi:integrase